MTVGLEGLLNKAKTFRRLFDEYVETENWKEFRKRRLIAKKDVESFLADKIVIPRKQLSDRLAKMLVPQKQYYDFEVERILKELLEQGKTVKEAQQK